MAQVNLGSIKFNWKGAYNAGTAYAIDDVVSYNGSSYVAKTATTGNLPTVTANWDIMSSAGSNGTDGTDVGATLANKEIAFKTNAGALDGIPIGTAGQFLKVNSGATGYEYGAVSSDFVRLGGANQSSMTSSISVDFFTTDYDIYKVFVTGMNISSPGSGTTLRFNSSAGNAVSGSNYRYIFDGGMRNNAGGNSSDQRTHSWDDSSMSLSNGSPNDYEQSNHEITVYRPMNASEQTKCIITGGGYENNHIYSRHGQGVYNATQAHTGITFLASTGNISIEHIEVYGIK